jgi:hypothetical protein
LRVVRHDFLSFSTAAWRAQHALGRLTTFLLVVPSLGASVPDQPKGEPMIQIRLSVDSTEIVREARAIRPTQPVSTLCATASAILMPSTPAERIPPA